VIEETLLTKLNAIIRTFPLKKPKTESFPCLIYQRIDTQENNTHSGKSLNRPRFQITCAAKTYIGAKNLAFLVKNALDLNKTDFILSHLINESDAMLDEENIYQIFLDFYIWEK
jgi:hypothetical protein